MRIRFSLVRPVLGTIRQIMSRSAPLILLMLCGGVIMVCSRGYPDKALEWIVTEWDKAYPRKIVYHSPPLVVRDGIYEVRLTSPTPQSPKPNGAISVEQWLDESIEAGIIAVEERNRAMLERDANPSELYGKIKFGPLGWVGKQELEQYCEDRFDLKHQKSRVEMDETHDLQIVVFRWHGPGGREPWHKLNGTTQGEAPIATATTKAR